MGKLIFSRPDALTEAQFSFCPGCDHGIVHRLIAQVIQDLGIKERTFAVWSVGCSVTAYNFFDLGGVLASHGRAPAVATGLSRALRLRNPDALVFTYQGDGDLAAIGVAEILHAANRGENFTAICINNGVFGMTSGQMGPTTVIGQKTATSPRGRNPAEHGYPIKICEMLATLEAPAYLARVALIDPKHVIKAGKAIKRAFEIQMQSGGFSFVEILAACPVNWGIHPKDCHDWIKRNMMTIFPLGELRTPEDKKKGGQQCAKT